MERIWNDAMCTGIFYSPDKNKMVSKTSENEWVMALKVDTLDIFKKSMGEYADYILNFIDQMNKVFEFGCTTWYSNG